MRTIILTSFLSLLPYFTFSQEIWQFDKIETVNDSVSKLVISNGREIYEEIISSILIEDIMSGLDAETHSDLLHKKFSSNFKNGEDALSELLLNNEIRRGQIIQKVLDEYGY